MTPEEQKAAQEAEAAAQAAAAAAAQAKPPTPTTQTREQVLEAELKRARAEAASYRQKARQEADAKKKADEDALAKAGQFKELADQRDRRVKELEAELEQSRASLATYQAREAEEQQRLVAQVDADLATLPDAVRADIPPDADLRTKQIAIKAYRAAVPGARPAAPPPTAPRPASGPVAEPPAVSDEEWQEYGNPAVPQQRKREIQAKNEARRAWEASR